MNEWDLKQDWQSENRAAFLFALDHDFKSFAQKLRRAFDEKNGIGAQIKSCVRLTLRVSFSGLCLALSDAVGPTQVDRLVVAHDLAEVDRVIKLLTVDEEGNVVGLESREHAGDVGDLDVAHFELNLDRNNKMKIRKNIF